MPDSEKLEEVYSPLPVEWGELCDNGGKCNFQADRGSPATAYIVCPHPRHIGTTLQFGWTPEPFRMILAEVGPDRTLVNWRVG